MGFKVGAAIAAAAMGLLASVSASAETYTFTLNGPYAAVWTIDSNPTPNRFGADSFVVQNVPGNYSQIPGNGPTNYIADIEFFTTSADGGFYISNVYDDAPDTIGLVSVIGDQLFTGTTLNPTFKTGSFILNDLESETRYSLVISPLAAAVPEPSTWAFMITGLGVVGGTLRTRKAVKPKTLAA